MHTGRCVQSWPGTEGGGKGAGRGVGGREGPSSQPTFLHPRERGCKLKPGLRKEPREVGVGIFLINNQLQLLMNQGSPGPQGTPGWRGIRRRPPSLLPPHPIAPPQQWGGGGVKPSHWGTSRSASPTPPFGDGRVPQGHGHTIPSIDESARPRGLLLCQAPSRLA